MKQMTFEASGEILSSTPFVVIDCETTGVSAQNDAITEIAAITICGGAQTGTFNTLVNPRRKLSDHIIRLTSITNEDVKDAPYIEQVLPSLLEFIGDKIIIGHNIKFDISFINAALERHNYQPLSNGSIDTLRVARKLFIKEVKDFKLSTLAAHIKTDNTPTHRAFKDVLATIDLFHHLVERSSDLGVSGVKDLITMPSARNRKRYSKRSLASEAPKEPGIYVFLSKDGKPLYIGKSNNIKDRLRSYFVSDTRYKISKLIHSAEKIEFITTPSAYEARILELRALAKYRPEYNVADINDSRFTYLALDKSEEIPTLRLQKYNKKLVNELFLGPFTNRSLALTFKDAIHFLFGIRSCTQAIAPDMKRPIVECLNSLQGLHSCFCVGDNSDLEEYKNRVNKLINNFPDTFHEYSAVLLNEMTKHSKNLRFERAKIFYEYSVSLQKWMNRFKMVNHSSKVNIKNSLNFCDVVEGRAVLRMNCNESDSVAKEILLNMELINNDVILGSNSDRIDSFGFDFLSHPKEFRERLTLAHFLERFNLVKI